MEQRKAEQGCQVQGVKIKWIIIFISFWGVIALLYFKFFRLWEAGIGNIK